MSKARDLAGLFNLGSRSGTTAQRPATADVGDIYYNGTTGKTEIYTTTGWKEMASGIPFGNTASRPTAVTGQPYFNGETARLEMYTSASGWQNIVQEVPGVASITGTYSEAANSGTITIAGTNFVSGAIASAIGTNGVEVLASSTTYNSLVQITAVFTGLSNANEPYDIKVTNPSNLFGLIPDALYVNASPVWQTASGSLGSFAEQVAMSVSATATDETAITYSLASGSTLPSGVTLNSSTGLISGTLPDVASNITYTFTINASDGLNPAIPRTFSFVSNAAPVWVTSSGSLGSFFNGTSITTSALSVTDSDTISYALASGSTLPSGLTLSSSTGVISGNLPAVTSNTTYTFTVNALDGLNAVGRQFSITSLTAIIAFESENYTSNASSWTDSISGVVLNKVGGTTTKTGNYQISMSSGNRYGFTTDTSSIQHISALDFGSSPFSIETWFYIPTTTFGQSTMNYANDGAQTSSGYRTFINNGQFWSDNEFNMYTPANGTELGFATNGGEGLRHPLSSIGTGWKHITLVKDSSGRKMYINGSLVTSDSVVHTIGVNTSLDLNINGFSQPTGTPQFNTNYGDQQVRFGHIRFYNSALTSTQLSSLYNATRSRYGL